MFDLLKDPAIAGAVGALVGAVAALLPDVAAYLRRRGMTQVELAQRAVDEAMRTPALHDDERAAILLASALKQRDIYDVLASAIEKAGRER